MKKITCCTLLKMWANKCFTLLAKTNKKRGKYTERKKRGKKNSAKCAHKAEAGAKAQASETAKTKAKSC